MTMDNQNEMPQKMPLIGDEAPAFAADTTVGRISFPDDYEGKWVILFSHPADFTPVCSSEIATFAAMTEEFKSMNTELLGVSVDSVSSHLAWLKSIQENIKYKAYDKQPITFPIVADVKMEVAKKYGMIQPYASDTKAVRAVFVIDPKHKIRAIIYYPLSTGRNFDEIKRLLQALQTTDDYGVSTPADWRPGDKVMVSAPTTFEAMQNASARQPAGVECEDWFFCRRNL